MAKIIFKGVPDFTEVRAEIAKLKQEVASVSSTKVNLNGTAQGLNGAAHAAGKLAQNLQKVSTTFDANGQVLYAGVQIINGELFSLYVYESE